MAGLLVRLACGWKQCWPGFHCGWSSLSLCGRSCVSWWCAVTAAVSPPRPGQAPALSGQKGKIPKWYLLVILTMAAWHLSQGRARGLCLSDELSKSASGVNTGACQTSASLLELGQVWLLPVPFRRGCCCNPLSSEWKLTGFQNTNSLEACLPKCRPPGRKAKVSLNCVLEDSACVASTSHLCVSLTYEVLVSQLDCTSTLFTARFLLARRRGGVSSESYTLYISHSSSIALFIYITSNIADSIQCWLKIPWIIAYIVPD